MLKHFKLPSHSVALLGLLLAACGAPRTETTSADFSTSESALSRIESTETGNGAPRRFELELVSDPADTSPPSAASLNRVTLPTDGTPQILTRFGGAGDLRVIDGNAADGFAALGLPKNRSMGRYGYAIAVQVPSEDGTTAAPGCVADPDAEALFCGMHATAVGAGSSVIRNVSSDLLTVEVDLDARGRVERLPLFDERLEGLTWSYGASGAQVATVGFFPLARP